jgi:hypothetical protein
MLRATCLSFTLSVENLRPPSRAEVLGLIRARVTDRRYSLDGNLSLAKS